MCSWCFNEYASHAVKQLFTIWILFDWAVPTIMRMHVWWRTRGYSAKNTENVLNNLSYSQFTVQQMFSTREYKKAIKSRITSKIFILRVTVGMSGTSIVKRTQVRTIKLWIFLNHTIYNLLKNHVKKSLRLCRSPEWWVLFLMNKSEVMLLVFSAWHVQYVSFTGSCTAINHVPRRPFHAIWSWPLLPFRNSSMQENFANHKINSRQKPNTCTLCVVLSPAGCERCMLRERNCTARC